MGKKVAGAHVVFHKKLKTRKYKKDYKLVQDAVQAVLLCKRTQDAPTHPGYWSLLGGQIEKNENPQKAALREVTEELEIKGLSKEKMLKRIEKEIEELETVKIMRKEGDASMIYFKAPLDVDMDKLRLKRNKEKDKVEGEGLGWFTAEEVHHLMMRPEERIAVTKFFRKSGV